MFDISYKTCMNFGGFCYYLWILCVQCGKVEFKLIKTGSENMSKQTANDKKWTLT